MHKVLEKSSTSLYAGDPVVGNIPGGDVFGYIVADVALRTGDAALVARLRATEHGRIIVAYVAKRHGAYANPPRRTRALRASRARVSRRARSARPSVSSDDSADDGGAAGPHRATISRTVRA